MTSEKLKQEIVRQLATIKGNRFVSITYLSKKANELARHTLNIGFNYNTLVEKSVTELELLIEENKLVWNDLQKEAAQEVLASLNKTLVAHQNGEQNDDYTKKGMYAPIVNGINVNLNDGSIQVFGLSHTKVVLVEGVYPTVNSKPLTIAKNEIRSLLSISKFREFAIDPGQVSECKVNGETLELTPA
jgi:hypothetical protein